METRVPDIPRPPSDRATVRRLAKRGVYDQATIYAILDQSLYCHVGFVDQNQPFVIPTIHARVGGQLVLHGSRASRMLACLAAGAPACITATILDGLVLARSTFHHSMNYRSVVVLGRATEITADAEKSAALEALVERVVPGRAAEARPANPQELQATAVVAFPLDECSAKVRAGPPADDADDLTLPVWAGVLPLSLVCGEPLPDPHLPPGTPVPRYIREYRRV
ncbi:MAG: hypothetical protein CHACPFDD_02608 [Phycisphaerae bacterium]|nr:hypothetical protein [Phycisphaerae bacterium]